MQREHFAIGLAEALAHRAHGFRELARGDLHFRIDDPFAECSVRHAALTFATQLAGLVAEQAHEPRHDVFSGCEVRARLDRLEEGPLQQVLGVGAVAREPERHAHEPTRGRVEHVAERFRVARATEVLETPIGGIAAEGHAQGMTRNEAHCYVEFAKMPTSLGPAHSPRRDREALRCGAPP